MSSPFYTDALKCFIFYYIPTYCEKSKIFFYAPDPWARILNKSTQEKG